MDENSQSKKEGHAEQELELRVKKETATLLVSR